MHICVLFVRHRDLTLLARVHHRVLLIRSHHDDGVQVEVVVVVIVPRFGADLALDVGQFLVFILTLLILNQLGRLEPEFLKNPLLLVGISKD